MQRIKFEVVVDSSRRIKSSVIKSKSMHEIFFEKLAGLKCTNNKNEQKGEESSNAIWAASNYAMSYVI